MNGLFDPTDPTVYGGAEVQLYLLATGLAAAGVETHAVTRPPGAPATYTAEGVTVHALRRRSGILGRALLWRDITKTLRGIAADVYVQRCAGIETYLVGRTAKRTGKRFAFMSASTQDCTDELIRRGQRLVYHIYQRGLWLTDCIIAQNETQRKLFEERWKLQADVLPSACRLIEPDGESGGGGILWMGRCEPYKGPEAFLDLAESLPELPFVMVMPGSVNPEYDARVRKRAQTLKNLELHGAVPLRETENFFQRASLHVNTSDFEGFPNTFLQAAAAGVPLTSLNVDPGGVLSREGLGWCAGGDAKALREKVAELYADPRACREYGQRGRAYIRAHHDRDVIVKRFREILESLLVVAPV